MSDDKDKKSYSITQGIKDTFAVLSVFAPIPNPTREGKIVKESVIENIAEIPGSFADLGNKVATKLGHPLYEGSYAQKTENALRQSFTDSTGIVPDSNHDRAMLKAGAVSALAITSAIPVSEATTAVRIAGEGGQVAKAGSLIARASELTGISQKSLVVGQTTASATNSARKAAEIIIQPTVP